VQGEYGVVGDYDGYLHWFRTSTGELVGRTRLDKSAVRGTPQVSADGTLYALSSEGKLAAFQVN
jgi:outer membrane protein assembly factor BamB